MPSSSLFPMTGSSDRIRALRAAVGVAPEDAGLRALLAEALLEQGDAPAAEAELREGLRIVPADGRLRLLLARTFHRQGKPSAALVVLEDALRNGDASADLGGMEGVKDEIRRRIIHPVRHPEMYRAYGKSVGGGVLMYGPPGCGKTHLARATAGEERVGFISVGIHEVLDVWMGKSEQNLNALFRRARAAAPCILFFDEVDALAARRSDMRTSAGRTLINKFLAEMDGIDGDNDGVLILAATNAPWHLGW